MKTFLRIVALLVVLGVVALAVFILWPVSRTDAVASFDGGTPTPEEGEYAMRLADCAACHTAEGGTPFAGGRPIESPLGTIYSSNITPDPDTGIGGYTLAQFRGALYDGLDDEGHHLYPAMPYANYRAIGEADVRRLYTYFTQTLEPVKNPVPDAELPFPFNQRWGLRAWKWVGLPDPGFAEVAEAGADPLARGAYLVEGPGHCGACHTPRNAVFAQAGFTAADGDFLTGGEIAGWTAPALRGPGSAVDGWSVQDIRDILATGRNAHAAINGEMQLVVRDSTQFMTEDDLTAIAAYLVDLNGGDASIPAEEETAGADARPAGFAETLTAEAETPTEALLNSADPGMDLGPRLYLDNCAACHFTDGGGADEVFPELAGNALVTADSPVGLLSMILAGSELPSTAERPYALRMPGFGDRLSDDEVAELANFLRSGWGNEAAPVVASDVTDLRGATNTAPH
ncbi:cytochrome c [Pseudooceanicola aestuarii]|uniref:cytochrome c n=1 Tax=Pseudooceanicola aestuarii TaxID=2697319 RepID=UPI0013D2F0CC|nr:cytochrome c [Pseudooceanicola aestuarii]